MKTINLKKSTYFYLVLFFLFAVLSDEGQTNDQYREMLKQKHIRYSDDVFLNYAQRGDKEVIDLFIKAGINIEAKDSYGNTALRMATSSFTGSPAKVVKLLISAGADVNVKTTNGLTPLMSSVTGMDPNSIYISMYKESIRREIAKLLINAGANVNDTDNEGKTALIYALKRSSPHMIKLLIENGADINAKDNKGHSVLNRAVERGNPEIIKLLVEKGANVNDSDRNGYTLLMYAAQYGNIETVRLLIQEGANINATRSDRETALFIAVRREIVSDQLLIIDMLLDNGANIEARGWYDETPLMRALSIGNIDVAERLINRGASMGARNNLGGTAINYATHYIEAVKLLIKYGADVNSKGNKGESVLMGAARLGNAQVVEALLENGADLNAKDNIGRSVLMYAAESGNVQVVKMLLAKGADVNIADRNGDTALEGHFYTVAPEIQKLLIEHGAQYTKKYEGIDIIEPVEGQRFKMGDKGKIVVKPKAGVELIAVSFGFEPLSYHSLKKAYVGQFQIPENIQPGKLEIRVIAYTKDKKETEASRNIIAEFPNDVTLTGIEMGDDGLHAIYLKKLPLGSALSRIEGYETEELHIYGIYSDGVKRDEITSPIYGTTYSTSNEKVAVVSPEGIVKAIGTGKAVITVKNGQFTTSKEVDVRPFK